MATRWTGPFALPPVADTPLVGDVAAFDEDSGLGTVEFGAGRTLPFHCTAITDGSRRIDVGAVVAFVVVPGRLGRLEAQSIRPLPGVVRPGSTLGGAGGPSGQVPGGQLPAPPVPAPPPGSGPVVIVITATDGQGHSARTVVHIGSHRGSGTAPNPRGAHNTLLPDSHGRLPLDPRAPVDLRMMRSDRAAMTARPGLTAQIRSAHRAGQLAHQAALLRAAEQMLRRS